MKAIMIFLTLCLLVFVSQAQTTTRRVNSDTNVDAPYRTIQAAIDAASIDDTILVEPSVIHYAGYTCAKRVHVIGSFTRTHLPNSYSQNIKSWVNSAIVYMPGSEGSVLMGLTLWDPDIALNTDLYLSASEIVVKRNSIDKLTLRSKNMANVPDTTHVDNCLIIQNYIYQLYSEKNANASTIIYANNLVIKNNIISSYIYLADTYVSYSTDLANNVIENASVYTRNANIYNNIFTPSLYDYIFQSTYNNTVTYNVFSRATPTGGLVYGVGNQFGINMTTVFKSTTATQLPYQLVPSTSPALGSGAGGEDCGIHGGIYPFVHGATADIPAIYHFTVRPVSNTQIEVEVKAAVRP
jgi:hypothetical protein